MTTLLQLNTSARRDGNANQLADEFVTTWTSNHAGTNVVKRDLAQNPLPHLGEEELGAFFTPAEQRTPEQAALAQASQDLIDELQRADVVVLSVPMYNFGIPSTLKAYFDRIARAGITFRYTSNGPEGLVQGKRVFVLAARGGKYAGTPADSQTGYLRNFLGLLGMTDVTFVYAEGLNMSEAEDAKAAARAEIARVAA